VRLRANGAVARLTAEQTRQLRFLALLSARKTRQPLLLRKLKNHLSPSQVFCSPPAQSSTKLSCTRSHKGTFSHEGDSATKAKWAQRHSSHKGDKKSGSPNLSSDTKIKYAYRIERRSCSSQVWPAPGDYTQNRERTLVHSTFMNERLHH